MKAEHFFSGQKAPCRATGLIVVFHAQSQAEPPSLSDVCSQEMAIACANCDLNCSRGRQQFLVN